jgi:AraC-like DNA-binding protein
MPPDLHQFSRYLPTDKQTRKWGWRLMDAGIQTLCPHVPYPESGHPQSYLFDKDGVRKLDEYQVVFLVSGQGRFESRSCPKTRVSGGQALLLFPGEWHRYRPDADTGWTEYWVGFRGREADRILESFFHRHRPVVQVSEPEALADLFDRLLGWLRREGDPNDQIPASHLPLILALLGPRNEDNPQKAGKDATLVSRAKASMLANLESRTDLQALARELGVSYSRFRFTFREQTGFSPRAFENHLKLNRARDLLRHEGMTVTETAQALGYTNIHYFSTAFKKQFGKSPANWVAGEVEQKS